MKYLNIRMKLIVRKPKLKKKSDIIREWLNMNCQWLSIAPTMLVESIIHQRPAVLQRRLQSGMKKQSSGSTLNQTKNNQIMRHRCQIFDYYFKALIPLSNLHY